MAFVEAKRVSGWAADKAALKELLKDNTTPAIGIE